MMKHLAAISTVREVDVDIHGRTPLTDQLNDSLVQDSFHCCSVYPISADTDSAHELSARMTFSPVHAKTLKYFEQHGYKNLIDPADGLFQYSYDCKGQVLFDQFIKVGLARWQAPVVRTRVTTQSRSV